MLVTLEFDMKTSPETLFTYFESESKLKKWLKPVQMLTLHMEEASSSIEKGSLFTLTLHKNKKIQEVQGEVVAYRYPDLFGVRLYFEHTVIDIFFEFKAQPQGTKLYCNCEIGVPEGTSALRAYISSWKFRNRLYWYLRALRAVY